MNITYIFSLGGCVFPHLAVGVSCSCVAQLGEGLLLERQQIPQALWIPPELVNVSISNLCTSWREKEGSNPSIITAPPAALPAGNSWL